MKCRDLRERLANVEWLLSGALEPGAIGQPVRCFTRGEMADIEMALAEIRALLEGIRSNNDKEST